MNSFLSFKKMLEIINNINFKEISVLKDFNDNE